MVFIEEGLFYVEVCYEVMMVMCDFGVDMVVEFCMDDDDVIVIDFIEIVQENLQNFSVFF